MKKEYLRLILIIPLVAVFSLFITTITKSYAADVYYKSAKVLTLNGQPEVALIYATKAISKNGKEPKYYYQRAKTYLTATLNQDEETKDKLKNLALKDMHEAYNLNSTNLVTLRNLVPLYYFLAIKDISKTVTTVEIDENYFGITQNYYSRVKNLSPNDVGIYTLLAKYEKRLGLENAYAESVTRVEELRPELLEWHPNFIQ